MSPPPASTRRNDDMVTGLDIELFQNSLVRDTVRFRRRSSLSSSRKLVFGSLELRPTASESPFPAEYARLQRVYVCPHCFAFFDSTRAHTRHMERCVNRKRVPVGKRVYEHCSRVVYEVDGCERIAFCQNLCVLARCFIDTKCLWLDVEGFAFYLFYERSSARNHEFVGYFSKLKAHSDRQNNLNCVMVMPQFQKHGYGTFIVDFSYLLSIREGKPGTPEKPLSPLAVVLYTSYWKKAIGAFVNRKLDQGSESVSINEVCLGTGIAVEDAVETMKTMGMLENDQNELVIKCPSSSMLQNRAALASLPTANKNKMIANWIPWTERDGAEYRKRKSHAMTTTDPPKVATKKAKTATDESETNGSLVKHDDDVIEQTDDDANEKKSLSSENEIVAKGGNRVEMDSAAENERPDETVDDKIQDSAGDEPIVAGDDDDDQNDVSQDATGVDEEIVEEAATVEKEVSTNPGTEKEESPVSRKRLSSSADPTNQKLTRISPTTISADTHDPTPNPIFHEIPIAPSPAPIQSTSPIPTPQMNFTPPTIPSYHHQYVNIPQPNMPFHYDQYQHQQYISPFQQQSYTSEQLYMTSYHQHTSIPRNPWFQPPSNYYMQMQYYNNNSNNNNQNQINGAGYYSPQMIATQRPFYGHNHTFPRLSSQGLGPQNIYQPPPPPDAPPNHPNNYEQ